MVVFEPRLWAFVAEPLQVGEPLQLCRSKLGPLRQCCDSFDVRNGPRGCAAATGCMGLRAGGPAADGQLMPVFVKSFGEAGIGL